MDLPEELFPIPDGASIVIHIRAQLELHPPASTTADDHGEEGGNPTYDPSRPRSRSPHQLPAGHPEEEVEDASFMAHQPHQVEDQGPVIDMPHVARQDDMESSSSSAVSTYDSEVQSMFFHLFQLKAPMVAARIRSDSWASTYSNVRHVLHLERHEIQYIHLVQTSPPDLRIAGTWAAIVQKRQDFAPGDS